MPMTFGEAMLSLIKKRGLSATAVAEELGFKSRTAFFRILHDESRMASIEKCFAAARNSRMLSLSEEEIAFLEEAMTVSEQGRQNYCMNRVLHRMIYPSGEVCSEEESILEGFGDVCAPEEAFDVMPQGGIVRIIILGRCSKRIMDKFHEMTKTRRVEQIVHLFALDEEDAEDIKILTEISDILFSSVYSCYYVNETNVAMKNWWLRSGIILVDHDDGQGNRTTLFLERVDKNRYIGFKDSTARVIEHWKRMIRYGFDKMVPLKRAGENEDHSHTLEHFIGFTDQFRKLESGRGIYMIKPDIPITCVPAEILRENVLEGLSGLQNAQDEATVQAFKQLYDIHAVRVDNFVRKKKPTHIVLSPHAMMEFARTGQRKDHFFLGRAYTVSERVKILEHLLTQTKDNPNFNIWLSSRDDLITDKEVTVYEGHGVAMIKADTSWRIQQDCEEIMLESSMIAQHFKSYFLSDILGKTVMPKEACIAFLEQMIDVAKDSQK